MDSTGQDMERAELSSRGDWSNDLRNPGAAGMPGANPGWNDPGQSALGGRSDAPNAEPHPGEEPLKPIDSAASGPQCQ